MDIQMAQRKDKAFQGLSRGWARRAGSRWRLGRCGRSRGMIETSTSAAMQEAEELMNALDFDCRYGTHVRGSHVSVTVTMMPEPESGRVRGMVHCHAFGHLRPNWAEIDVFLDYGPDFGQLKFNQSGAAAFEFALSTGGDHLFHLYAVSRSRTPLVTQEMAASVAD